MENLRKTIRILFSCTNPETVIRRSKNIEKKDWTEIPYRDEYCDIAETMDHDHTRNEFEEVYKKASASWLLPMDSRFGDKKNVFYPILHFVTDALIEKDEHPFCKFSQLLRWRELSYELGEDIFTTAYFANSDLESKRRRHFFAWNPTIKTNNQILKDITKRGLSELHFHLLGSSLNFDISWLSLMNDPCNRIPDFEELNKSKAARPKIYYNEVSLSLYALYIKAVAIRMYLFTVLSKINNYKEIDEHQRDPQRERGYDEEEICLLKNVTYARTEEEVHIYVPDLIDYCTTLKALYGKKYRGECLDYAIRENLSERSCDKNSYINVILSGERWILYKMFQKIYSNDKICEPLYPLFHAYLIIKSQIRQELIQLNGNPGFSNFQEYQNRKCVFIKENTVYADLVINSAIANAFINQNVSYLEARIQPRDTVPSNIRNIENLDRQAQMLLFSNSTAPIYEEDTYVAQRASYDFYYILHFIKSNADYRDGNIKDPLICMVQPRFAALRKRVKKQTKAINNIRKNHIAISDRIVGIDAASSEIGVRPEIFAQAYRYLKRYSHEDQDYMLINTKRNPLGYTYHVGEDFLDITDGLRAIDEVVKFLNFGRGDRLGHALALGVDAEKYYQKKKYHIALPKQDYLDNIVWLLKQVNKYNIQMTSTLSQKLKDSYWKLFYEIYNIQSQVYDDGYVQQSTNIPPYVYYQSWLLRGDDPMLYLDIREKDGSTTSEREEYPMQYWSRKDNKLHFNPITFWHRCGRNEGGEFDVARSNLTAIKLYQAYHFDPNVRKQGALVEEFEVTEEYVRVISCVQRKMQRELADMHIAIETNPTSNKLIGPFDKYIDHPITQFYNLGLATTNGERNDTCAQLSVSINTDDLGVFGTNLENEYALMAIALEKAKTKEGERLYVNRTVYNWLENIRQMGEEQRFKK